MPPTVTGTEIKPERITKPIQLLATWLAGLVLLVVVLIIGSAQTYPVKWINCLFAITVVAIIPLFLILVFLLQTKYRPEMQEDKFYYLSKYTKELNKSTTLDIGEIIKNG